MATEMKTYTAEASRDEAGWWVASVKGVPGCHSQAKSLKQLRTRLRDALTLFVPNAKAADLVVTPRLDRQANILLLEYEEARKRERQASERLQMVLRDVSQELTRRCKLSARDAGELLGLSHARVNIVARRKVSAAKVTRR
jgi:predicted RNase H-like HicB family nuclease